MLEKVWTHQGSNLDSLIKSLQMLRCPLAQREFRIEGEARALSEIVLEPSQPGGGVPCREQECIQ